MCNKKETYIWKTIGDNTNWFKVRINQHICDCKTGVSKCKFPIMFTIVVLRIIAWKSRSLEEPFFSLNIMLRLNKSDRLETIENHFHLKRYDTMNNLGRN